MLGRTALLIAAALAGCAAPLQARSPGGDDGALGSRLARRAASLLGEGRAPFVVGAERFNPDCTGFVEAVYQAEGIPLRLLMQRAAPAERSGVAAAWRAFEANGRTFGAGVRPRPGDAVFWRFTYDRNGNGRLDDGLTHMGIVEVVDGDAVTFLHRGGGGVVRGVMDLARPQLAREMNGRPVNSALRVKGAAWAGAPDLAGALFAGYGRIEPARIGAVRPRAGRGEPRSAAR